VGDAASGVSSQTVSCTGYDFLSGRLLPAVYEQDFSNGVTSQAVATIWSGPPDVTIPPVVLMGLSVDKTALPTHAETLLSDMTVKFRYRSGLFAEWGVDTTTSPPTGIFTWDMTGRTPIVRAADCPGANLVSGCATIRGRFHAVLVPLTLDTRGTVTMDWTF
jgi:hypothetical protein